MKCFLLAATVSALAVTNAVASPVTEREDLMKERSAVLRVLGPIAQERQPFDAGVVMEELEKLNANAQATDVAALWPEGSGDGSDSAPAVWENWDAYVAANEEYAADVAAALEAAPEDLTSFQAVFGPVAANCGACHQDYRL